MARFGAFGKIPSAGDFIRFDLGPGVVDQWDRFVQRAMTEARTALGERWRTCYFNAPMWRFTLDAGQMGRHGGLGVMMPSVDRVGRQFPLTLAVPLLSPQPTVQLHFESGPVFEALETIALAALDDLPLERLKQRLTTVRAPKPCHRLRGGPRAGGAAAYCLDGSGDIPAVLAAQRLSEGLTSPSVWSAELSKGSRLLVCDGLPAAADCVALFDTDAALWPTGAAA